MPKQFSRFAALVVLATFAAAVPARATEEPHVRPTLAVVDFDVTPGGSTLPPPHLGATAAQLLLDKLVSAAEYHMLDGRWLQTGDRTSDPRMAAQLLRANAREAGVDYLVFGSITRFSAENRQRAVGGGGFVCRWSGDTGDRRMIWWSLSGPASWTFGMVRLWPRQPARAAAPGERSHWVLLDLSRSAPAA
jgi:curli biogenesis system outer membrane secretion channel CsgG